MSTKILHILKSAGGVEVAVRMITEHTDPKKITNYFAHDDTNKTYTDKNNKNLKTFIIPLRRELSVINDIKCIRSIHRIIKEEGIAKIHCHSSKAGLLGRVIGLLFGVKVFYTPQAFSYLSSQNPLKRSLFILIERFTKFQKTTHFIASSNSERQRALADIKYKQSNVSVWNNSIKPIEELNKTQQYNQKYICTVGRPSFQKNIEMLIEAMHLIQKDHPNLHLKIIGAGYYSPNTKILESLIKKYNIQDKVEIIEWCDRDTTLNYIKQSEFVISTARYEGLPLWLIEALALGKVSVATNVDGNKDLIIDNYNGYLVENEDFLTLSVKMKQLLDNPEQVKLFSDNAINHFNQHFNVEENIDKIENIYLS